MNHRVYTVLEKNNSRNVVHVFEDSNGKVSVTLHFGQRNNSCASMVEGSLLSRDEAARTIRSYWKKLHTWHLPW